MSSKKNKLIVAAIFIIAGFTIVAGAYGFGNISFSRKSSPVINEKEEFKKLCKNFSALHANVSGTIRLYEEDKNTLKETTSFIYLRKGAELYSQMGHLQVFSDGKITIQLDTLSESISVVKATAEYGQSFLAEKFFKDTLAFKTNISVTDNGGSRSMSIVSELSPEIRTCEIIYDTESYQVLRVDIKWWKEPGNAEIKDCWITKIDYSYNSVPDVDIKRRMADIVELTGGTLKANPLYREYKIYNGLN